MPFTYLLKSGVFATHNAELPAVTEHVGKWEISAAQQAQIVAGARLALESDGTLMIVLDAGPPIEIVELEPPTAALDPEVVVPDENTY
jgi:hypothetical protein